MNEDGNGYVRLNNSYFSEGGDVASLSGSGSSGSGASTVHKVEGTLNPVTGEVRFSAAGRAVVTATVGTDAPGGKPLIPSGVATVTVGNSYAHNAAQSAYTRSVKVFAGSFSDAQIIAAAT